MSHVFATERQAQIMQRLITNGHVKIADIVNTFSVTSETARKDLLDLQKRGMAKKVHGGAIIVDGYFAGSNVLFNKRMERNVAKKRIIAVKAAELVQDGNTIILDSGSTTYRLAEQLIYKKDILVITNGLPIAMYLADNDVRVLCIGGEVHKSGLSSVGMWVGTVLKNIQANIAFIGASGYNSTRGPSVENFPEAQAKWKMMESASKRYIVSDSSKAKVDALIEYASWDNFDGLITDMDIPEDLHRELEKKLQVIIADK